MKNVAFLLFSSLILSCTSSKPTGTSEVPYTIAQNYFVKNDVKENNAFKITSQAELDASYGIGRTMSDNSKPTVIDFSKSFAIAVLAPVSDEISGIRIEYLQKGKDSLFLQYKIEKGQKQSFSTRQTKLLIVDKQYDLPLSVSEK